MAGWSALTCQWVSADQTVSWDRPLDYCGKKVIDGRYYCHDHYFRIYQKGTSVNGKRISKMIEKEIEEIKTAEELEEMEDGDETRGNLE
jgi:hypothetical protein